MRLLRWMWRTLVAGVLVLIRRRRDDNGEPFERELVAGPGSELGVAVLLAVAGLAGVGFVVAYAAGGDTQALGLTIGAGLGLLGLALIVASRRLVPQERESEERPEFARPDVEREEQIDRTERLVRAGVDGITRRRLLAAAGGLAGAGLGAAALSPLASFGPRVGDSLRASPWRDGTPLVDENDLPVLASDLGVGSFLTAFAKGADRKALATSVVVVRVRPGELDLPAERRDWAPEGLLAFSKICTHAQCAINLFRYPLYPDRSPGPALVCPCHYSTFDVLRGGERIFGPAVRALPQLPLTIGDDGALVAAGELSGSVGASWGGVREDS